MGYIWRRTFVSSHALIFYHIPLHSYSLYHEFPIAAKINASNFNQLGNFFPLDNHKLYFLKNT
nr:MAG TPA: hypothetical protein [Caudoviricetes sp.]DAK65403.1 MAG TPA: hypothetical protein [Caudoviricetes sp.]DAQ80453.1 MAG TPA: hypothetical protein [Herelleviridae sp.]